jgi:predicted MFS family arabinose efflux permease
MSGSLTRNLRGLVPVLPILIGASLLLSVAMGIRQSLGIFLQPLTHDVGISVSDFTLAVALQNLAWGFLQPIAGALTVRLGFRLVMVIGALSYVTGLALLATAHGFLSIVIGAGVLIGLALACTGSAIANAVAARAVSTAMRSTMLGIVSAAGSLGTLLAAPIGEVLSQDYGWRIGIAGFCLLAALLVPAAWVAGRVDRIPVPPNTGATDIDDSRAATAVRAALSNPSFVVMTCAYFVCGMQLVFITTHLPSYLAICGMDPMLSAEALGVIGGFNALGSLFFGWAGGRWNKLALLGGIYITRSLTLAWYFMLPPTPTTTLIFAGVMGFLWLGVSPLVSGSIVEMFGLRWQAMIAGIAFSSHQLGSFLGAYGGGLAFDTTGSYDLAWHIGVSLGLTGGIVQVAFALLRPTPPPMLAAR